MRDWGGRVEGTGQAALDDEPDELSEPLLVDVDVVDDESEDELDDADVADEAELDDVDDDEPPRLSVL
jgi:hypothetical protein